jgi:iron complex outermembrane receptor protein
VAGYAQVTDPETTTQPANTPTGAETPDQDADLASGPQNNAEIVVTGSRIRQNPNNSALPLQIVTTQELSREGISSPEQLIMYLSTNGNGADNLASNSDVTSGAQRGTNGLSAANLRGQGSASTLVLLNGRRVAAHGLTGSAVDVNQIPFAAIERVEVLKDGASAIYGTDAIGGVINFITRKNFTGVSLTGFTDITEQGDSPIYRLSATAGYGDLSSQGFNIMGAVSKSWNGVLNGSDRDFVNGNQPQSRAFDRHARHADRHCVSDWAERDLRAHGFAAERREPSRSGGDDRCEWRHQHPRSSGRRGLRVGRRGPCL